jgi:hypothetical protein
MPTLSAIEQKNYNEFIPILNKALEKHPEYNTPKWRNFFIHLAWKESKFNPTAENGEHLGYFQIKNAYRNYTKDSPYED